MAKITLASYLLKLTNKNNGEVQELDRIKVGAEYIHINEVLKKYFDSKKGDYTDNKKKQKFFTIQSHYQSKKSQGNLVIYNKHEGVLETGSYGYSSKIYDKETRDILFEKSPDNPEMLPFFYGIYTPESGTECICIFQRFSNYGFKSIFESELVDYFKQNYSDYKITMNALLPSDYINNFITDGRLLKLRLLKNSLPEDLADAIGNNNENAKAELVIKAEARGNLGIRNNILRIFHKESTVTQAFEVQGFEYDSAKIEVKIGSTKKTIDLGELENVTGYFDITEDVEIDDGHPSFNSIQGVSEEYAEHFLKERNIIV